MKPEILTVLLLIHGTFVCSENGEKVAGGSTVSIEEYPFVVSIRDMNHSHYCGGSILKKDWILTAAHCLDQDAHTLKFTVQVGRHSLSSDVDSSVYNIERAIKHPRFNAISRVNNIALIKLKKPLTFSSTVKSVKLPEQWSEVDETNYAVTVIGYGKRGPLKKAEYFAISTNQCKMIYCSQNRTIFSSNICAAYPTGGKGWQTGDGGGPLVQNGTQVGIGARFVRVADGSQPDIFTKVSNFIDFIDWHIKI